MRYIVVAALALVVGVVVGGLSPRAKVRALEGQLAEAEECKSGGMGTEIAAMLGAGRLQRPPERADSPEAPAGDGVADADPPDAEGFHVTIDEPSAEGGEVRSIGAMQEALELRRTQARAALVEDAEPSDEQLDDFDSAVDKMNEELTDLARDLVAEFAEGGEPTRRDAMAFAADALDILVTAEDQFAASLDDEQLDALPEEALDPLSYLDPELLALLGQLDRGTGE